MEFRRMTSASHPDYEKAMALYRSSFSYHELREEASQERIMSHPQYHFDCVYDGTCWAGLILYWETESFIYVEHFCVDPSMRGHGLGTLILAELAKTNKPIILEIDPLTDDVAIRRKGFYERCGYVANGFAHIHPPYQAANHGHTLIVMSHPRALSQAEFDTFTVDLREKVMKYSESKRNG